MYSTTHLHVAEPGPTVVVHYGRLPLHGSGRGAAVTGVIFMVVSVVAVFFGILVLTGVFGKEKSFDERTQEFFSTGKTGDNNMFQKPLGFFLTGAGVLMFLAGLGVFIPAYRYQKKRAENRQRSSGYNPSAERPAQLPYQSRLHQPAQSQYQSPYLGQSSHQQGSAIATLPLQSDPSYQWASAAPPQPVQSIPASMNPPPYGWTPSAGYPNAGFAPYEDPEYRRNNDN